MGVGEEGVEDRGVAAGDTPTYEHQLWLVSLNLQRPPEVREGLCNPLLLHTHLPHELVGFVVSVLD